MFVRGIGTATPPRQYAQLECWEALVASAVFGDLNPRAQSILRKVLRGNNGIRARYLALDDLREAFELQPDALHARFARNAPALAKEAALEALQQSALAPADLDALLISTCTGYLCPGLTSYLSELLGLRPDALALDLVGQGCGAAVPNLRTAESLIQSGGYRHVLSICVEVCSAAFYLDNDPGVLISACLFGDGAGAAVLSRDWNPARRRIQWRGAGTTLSPADRDYLRFETRGGMLRNILAPQVPGLAAKHAETVLARALAGAGIGREEIRAWILHPGGREVLTALRNRLGLADADLKVSARILEEHGNLSSASLYFVLKATLAEQAPAGFWWLSSFGAGFTCHGALLEVS